jgi:hypothetical protein
MRFAITHTLSLASGCDRTGDNLIQLVASRSAGNPEVASGEISLREGDRSKRRAGRLSNGQMYEDVRITLILDFASLFAQRATRKYQ